jgi:hypothetical protein
VGHECFAGHYTRQRWGTIPEFQCTRGLLPLLVDVIANLYRAKDNES